MCRAVKLGRTISPRSWMGTTSKNVAQNVIGLWAVSLAHHLIDNNTFMSFLKNIINEMITGAATVTRIIKVLVSDFDGNDFQDDRLIDKAADTGFTVHGDGGAGVLLEEGNGYDFDSGTGTITIDAANGGPTKLRIVIV